MGSFSICLVVCLVVVATSAVSVKKNLPPPSLDGADNQCIDHGHAGACNDINYNLKEFNCANVACWRKKTSPGQDPVAYIGKALDWTFCAQNHVCKSGKCQKVDPKDIPLQKGGNPRFVCKKK